MRLASIHRTGRPTPLAETAADWALRQEKGLSDSEQQRFEAWLAEDPAHIAAYEDAIWALDASARHAGAPELMAMREAALSARRERRSTGWAWGGLAGAVAAAALILWLWVVPQTIVAPPIAPNGPAVQRTTDPNRAVYATAVGERLAVTLPEGSVATLDTDSRIRVAYSGAERGVHLLRGQALFEVAHGRPLPFQVHAAGQRIIAVGTTFNVRLDGNRVKVALIEGVVRVQADAPRASAPGASAPTRELVLRAGDTAELRPTQLAVVRSADVNQVASWRGGELVFNDTRLADAVAEINRYTRRPIAIADSAVGDYRVTGVFRTNDPERFSQAMSEVFSLDVTHGPNGAPVLRSRD